MENTYLLSTIPIYVDHRKPTVINIIGPIKSYYSAETFNSIEPHLITWETIRKIMANNIDDLKQEDIKVLIQNTTGTLDFLKEFTKVALFGKDQNRINIAFTWKVPLTSNPISSSNLYFERVSLFGNLALLYQHMALSVYMKAAEFKNCAIAAMTAFNELIMEADKDPSLSRTQDFDCTWLMINQLIVEAFIYCNPSAIADSKTPLEAGQALMYGAKLYKRVIYIISKAEKKIKDRFKCMNVTLAYNKKVMRYYAYKKYLEHYQNELKDNKKGMKFVIACQTKIISILSNKPIDDKKKMALLVNALKIEQTALENYKKENLKFYMEDDKFGNPKIIETNEFNYPIYQYRQIKLTGAFINAALLEKLKKELKDNWSMAIGKLEKESTDMNQLEDTFLKSNNIELSLGSMGVPTYILDPFKEFQNNGGVKYFIDFASQLSITHGDLIRNQCKWMEQMLFKNKVNPINVLQLKAMISNINKNVATAEQRVAQSIELFEKSYIPKFEFLQKDIDECASFILTESMTAVKTNQSEKNEKILNVLYNKRKERAELISLIRDVHQVLLSITISKQIVNEEQLKEEAFAKIKSCAGKLRELHTNGQQQELQSLIGEYKIYVLEKMDKMKTKKLDEFCKKLKIINNMKKIVEQTKQLFEKIISVEIKKAKLLVQDDIKKSMGLY